MKRSREIYNLSIIGINEGKVLGRVKSLVLNPVEKRVEYVLVDQTSVPGEVMVLPFKDVAGIGEDALTIFDQSCLGALKNFPAVVELMAKDVQVTGLKVLTDKGTLFGTVEEYTVDEESGMIIGCYVQNLQGDSAGIIPAASIITYSPFYLIVKRDFQAVPENSLEDKVSSPAGQEPVGEKASEESVSGFDSFAKRQREFLAGRTVARDILDDGGKIIAREGEIITEELIERATLADKYIELTMSTK